MWEWLAALPMAWQVLLPILVLVVIVIVSIWGNAIFRWGRRSVRFGKQSRSCIRCRQLMTTKTYKYKTDRELVRRAILRDQMNYAEMKVHEIFLSLCRSYRETLVNFRQPESEIDITREHKEYLIYQESLANSMIMVKNELRRSFKENGFSEMSAVEYTHYCKEKTKALITLSREYLMGRYPFETMIVPLQYRFEQLHVDEMETVVFNIMDRAKEVYLDAQEKLDKLDKQFDIEMEKLGNE